LWSAQVAPINQAGQPDERRPSGVIGSPRPNLLVPAEKSVLVAGVDVAADCRYASGRLCRRSCPFSRPYEHRRTHAPPSSSKSCRYGTSCRCCNALDRGGCGSRRPTGASGSRSFDRSGSSVAGHRAVVLENLALRQQLAVLRRTVKRPQLSTRDRLFWVVLAKAWRDWRTALIVVRPNTVVRWHRQWLRRRSAGDQLSIQSKWLRNSGAVVLAKDTLHSQPGELLELSCAVAQLLRRHAEEVEHRELQVRQRRVFWIDEMAAALESARASAD
jgi:hypothetical protein